MSELSNEKCLECGNLTPFRWGKPNLGARRWCCLKCERKWRTKDYIKRMKVLIPNYRAENSKNFRIKNPNYFRNYYLKNKIQIKLNEKKSKLKKLIGEKNDINNGQSTQG